MFPNISPNCLDHDLGLKKKCSFEKKCSIEFSLMAGFYFNQQLSDTSYEMGGQTVKGVKLPCV